MKNTTGKVISPLDSIREWLVTDLLAVEEQLGLILSSQLGFAQQAIVELHRAGGKRIRPLLTILVNKTSTDSPIPLDTTRLAAIVEALHLISLIHDDVIDEATTRRHHQSLNFAYGNRFAVLVGDFAYARLFRTLVDHFEHTVLDYLANLVVEICEGALAENIASNNLNLKEADYYHFLNGKTASLFGASLALGALSRGTDNNATAWEQLGREFGIAYQIVDDILDFVGDDKLGKGRFRDLPNGKITLPVIHLLGKNDGKATPMVEAIIKGDNTLQVELVKLLESNGSLEYAYRQAQARADHALDILRQLPATKGTERMAEIIRWLPIRDK